MNTAELRLRMLAEVSRDPVWEWNLRDNTVIWHGRSEVLRAWGFQEDQAGEPLLPRVHPEDHTTLRRALHDHLAGRKQRYEAEVRLKHARHGWRWVQVSGLLARDVSDHPLALFGSINDVQDQRTAEARIAWSQRHDPLTGLNNRVGFLEDLDAALRRARELCQRGWMAAVDIDRFKEVNRALGPRAGDALLVRLSERLAAVGSTTLGRLGSDSFGMILAAGDWSQEQANRTAEEVLRAIAVPLRVDGHEVSVSASIGLVSFGPEDLAPQDLIRDAERAVARAKRQGGGRYTAYEDASESGPLSRISMETRLRRAVHEGALWVAYQPIVDLPSREIVSFEALVRWSDPDLGNVSPAEFIPLAESCGLILPIGEFVLDEACRTLASWRRDTHAKHLKMNVNLSAVQFTQSDLVQRVNATLKRHPGAEGHLVLELTETALLERPQDQAVVLQKLRDLGIQIHIDDFGTGYSSLANLVRLPVDALKVDREFVRNAEQDPRSRAIVSAVARLAQELGLSLTAEGIETESQASLVIALGRCRGQGYLFSRPLPADQALLELTEPTTVLRRAG